MKRLIAVFLAVALLIPYAIAEAPVNVRDLSDSELKALYTEVKEELMERKLWESAVLPAGVYQIGRNMPEGSYECVSRGSGTVFVYSNFENYLADKRMYYFFVSEGESFVMTLYENICYCTTKEATVRPFTGLSW